MITRHKVLLEKLYMCADALDRYKQFPNVPNCIEDKNSTRNVLKLDLLNYVTAIVCYDGLITTRECNFFELFLGISLQPEDIISIYNNYVKNTGFLDRLPESFLRFVEYDEARGAKKDGISCILVSLYTSLYKFIQWIDKADKRNDGYKYCCRMESCVKKRIPEAEFTKILIDGWDLLTFEEFEAWDAGGGLPNVDGVAVNNSPKAAVKEASDDEFDAIKRVSTRKADDPESLQDLLDDLESLIGLDSIKNDVRSLINLISVMSLRQKRGMKKIPVSLHLVFSGNPGTGKTTVARLLAKIYNKMGLLSKGHLVEVDRSGLVAGYVGQTAIKTKEVIDSALGGVLFIDEAYALTTSDSSNDFGQEAVDTILKAMEDNRDDFVVIAAGYPDLMVKFVESNPGLKSRFNKFMYFADYTPEELKQIFLKQCRDNGYIAEQDVIDYVLKSYEDNYDKREANFANGRSVRNAFEKIIANQANRVALINNISDKALVLITMEDLEGIRF